MRKIYVDIGYNKSKIKGYVLDLSMGGMNVASPVKLDKNCIIDICVKDKILPQMKGKVVSAVYVRQRRAYKYRLGIKFIPLREAAALSRLMHKLEHRKAVRLTLLKTWKQG